MIIYLICRADRSTEGSPQKKENSMQSKLKVLVVLILFCAALPAHATIALSTSGQAQGINPGSLNVTLNSVPANSLIVAHITASAAPSTVTGIKDCTGSSACSGSSADTLTAGIACVQPNSNASGLTVCMYYVCSSSLSGTMTTTATFSGSLVETLEVESWTGVAATSCLDTTGTNASAGAASPSTATTSGNITSSNEVLIGAFIGGSTAPSVGSGFTIVQNGATFVFFSEYKLNPSSGSTATVTTAYTGSIAWSQTAEAFVPPATGTARHKILQAKKMNDPNYLFLRYLVRTSKFLGDYDSRRIY